MSADSDVKSPAVDSPAQSGPWIQMTGAITVKIRILAAFLNDVL